MSLARYSCSLLFAAIPLATGCSPARVVSAPKAQGFTRAPIPIAVQVVTVRRITLQESVKLVGALTAKHRAVAAAALTGRVMAVLVREGDVVRADQALVQLDDRDARLRLIAAEGSGVLASHQAEEALRQAQARELQAESELEQTRLATEAAIGSAQARLTTAQAKLRLVLAGPRPQEIERARADVDGAQVSVTDAQSYADYTERTLKRKQILFDKGYISKQEMDHAELDFHQAQNSVQSQKHQLRGLQQTVKILEAGARKEEVAQAEAEAAAATADLRAAQAGSALVTQRQQELASARAETRRAVSAMNAARYDTAGGRTNRTLNIAQATIRLAQEDLAHTVIRAPLAGIVTARRVEPGDVVQGGVDLLEIQDLRSLSLTMTLSDRDAGRVHAGQLVQIRIDGAPPQTLTGTVRALIPPSAASGGIFQVDVALPSSGAGLRPGALAAGLIVTATVPNALAVPLSALLTEGADAYNSEVFVVIQGRVYRRGVQLGVRAAGQAQVTAGLHPGEWVVTADQSLLRDGCPVETRIDSPPQVPSPAAERIESGGVGQVR